MVEANTLPISVVIPTYRREQVLVDTLNYLLALNPRAMEIVVVDQTERHEEATRDALTALESAGAIRWIRLPEPSITHAMNVGLEAAREGIVLFLDDDIRPEVGLLGAHAQGHARLDRVIVAGRVIQPWEEGDDFVGYKSFRFAGLRSSWIQEFMGGNFSVRREHALEIGGFDENFVRVAYRFEAEFAYRYIQSGGRIWFEAGACLHHLKEYSGGTRTFGHHLTSWRPDHAVGAYYFALRTGAWLDLFRRPLRAVATRHHLAHPWQIPRTGTAELRGLIWALALRLRGPRLLRQECAGRAREPHSSHG